MKDFDGKVAVVTGAASGIGRALARTFGSQGMKVVLADVEGPALERAADDLTKAGIEILPVLTDVSRPDEVDALAKAALGKFGAVHIVCNNAGVFAGGLSWEAPLDDYRWVFGVNVWGVLHGLRSFVPILLEQNVEAHIVNTASMAAVTNAPLTAPYYMSKHAVLSLSETLYLELQQMGAPIGVSALCPELVSTRIAESERNRPALPKSLDSSPQAEIAMQALRETMKLGVPPETIAERTLAAIRENRFYILSDEFFRKAAETRLEDIHLGRNPTFVDFGPNLEAIAGAGGKTR